ncbi:class I SAM-dependent methyltransferase [Roseateles chitinivorans]|uniref:class I SAM-dependent methyltransferase n=1 Tax=Roseateles chitinivorans TaxID=2917965 RepID=UPI003D67F3F2
MSSDRPFWRDLGVTHEIKGQPALVPAMARKWKQINKFIEIFGAAVRKAALDAPGTTVRLADFGSGKGYLTFAMHDWLHAQGLTPAVQGVELKQDMVALGNAAAARHGLAGLRFEHGDVRERGDQPLDVMVALHACDIATDYAMHFGLRSGARVIMCAPCCHKEIRPQMTTPAALRPLLQHGIHLGQEAEMVTDSLRALLLELMGYDTQVIEFIALEHTSKNKMVLAVKRPQDPTPARRTELLAQLDEIKRFYGLRSQALETLLRVEGKLEPEAA